MNKDKFPWGKVIKIHKIDYFDSEIIEYEVGDDWRIPGENEIQFHCNDFHTDTLEEAIILMICQKNNNEDAFRWVMKLIKEDTNE